MSFWKPGTVAPGSSLDRDTENETGEAVVAHAEKQYRHLTLTQQRERLPVFKLRRELLYLLEKYQTVIVVGQTGSGKTTQIPQYLMESGWASQGKNIVCTQTSDRTKIKYMTDGMLFRETMIDPLLTNYTVIMIDEAHERSLYTDMLIGVIKKIQKKRPELRVIISSATMDAEQFHGFFNANTTRDPQKDTAAIISLEGRMHPVDILYAEKPIVDYVEKCIQTVFDIHMKEPAGDILVFMTGREEIDTVVSEIYERGKTLPKNSLAVMPLPLYAGLTIEEQLQVFEPTPKYTRKVIVSTNIAEASVTLEGVVYVIDTGFAKRAGRAGRVKPGKAFRLYTEETYNTLRDTSIPEIQRSNLAPIILQLKALGIDNVLRFDFITPPPAELMTRALELLYSLKALDDVGRLTIPLGLQLAEFPVDPMLGKILLASKEFGCSHEIVTIAAMVSVQNIFIQPAKVPREVIHEARRKFWVEEGDSLTLINVYNAFINKGNKSGKWCHDRFLNFKALSRAMTIRLQLIKYLKRFDIPLVSATAKYPKTAEGRLAASQDVRKCITSGYFSQAAIAESDGSGRFRTIRDGVLLQIHPNSVLFNRNPKCVVFHEVIETTQAYMRDLTVIEPEWLAELAPHFYEYKKT
ncbi:P-loop containing nucleoside triphosphate hydrolase protein [Parasitella parasitica]|nr:P-loop containing nucleoside triphosphate hydrolase protein [Parasitella parasitica]